MPGCCEYKLWQPKIFGDIQISKQAGLEAQSGVDKLKRHDSKDTAAFNLTGFGQDNRFIAPLIK